uniref:Uncharacterized protein n=1 Tax=Anguilla anguilla TaxID=7936 RepID=A0A0E9TCR5_ANGAN
MGYGTTWRPPSQCFLSHFRLQVSPPTDMSLEKRHFTCSSTGAGHTPFH